MTLDIELLANRAFRLRAAPKSMDIFPSPIVDAAIVVFIHGGYWRALDKASYSFVAEPFVKNKCTVCVLNYRLMPRVRMQAILDDVGNALQWIIEQARVINGDPSRIVVSGHSAGGHLALMSYVLNEGLHDSIRAVCSLSGIFDLAPIPSSYLGDELKLDDDEVKRFSVPGQRRLNVDCPVYIGVGSAESDFFVRQSRTLFDQLSQTSPVKYREYEGLNHYEVVHQLGDEESDIAQFILIEVKR